MLLQVLGADVRVVYDGQAALDAVRAYQPSLVLLDIGMPGLDGYEVARRVRADPGCRGITLAALTGWGQLEDRRRTREAGIRSSSREAHRPRVAAIGAGVVSKPPLVAGGSTGRRVGGIMRVTHREPEEESMRATAASS
jgi:CheY-like chemotaxis protein